jgi:hypothetical protein
MKAAGFSTATSGVVSAIYQGAVQVAGGSAFNNAQQQTQATQ